MIFSQFFSWVRKTLDNLCERPDHLQRLSIIGAGIAIYPLVLFLAWVIWKGFGTHIELMPQQIQILGYALFGSLALLAVVIVTQLGTIKGLHISGPGGVEIQLDTTAEAKDNDKPAPTQTITTTTHIETTPAPLAPPAPPAKPPEGDVV